MDETLDPLSAYHVGSDHFRQGRWAEGLEWFLAIADGRYGVLDERLLETVQEHAMRAAAELGRWEQLGAIASAAIEQLPRQAEAWRRLGEAHYYRGRRQEAEAAFRQALEIDPDFAQARAALAILKAEPSEPDSGPATVVRPWPVRARRFADPRSLIAKFLLRGLPDDRFIRPDSAFFTLGSCFANNLAIRLSDRGYQVRYEDIGEEVNSTFANRSLLDWIEHGPMDGPTTVMDELYGPAVRQRFLEGLQDCDVFVMTLGVAACFFRKDSGAFAFAPLSTRLGHESLLFRHVMKTTSVAQNVENISAIIAAVRRLAKRPPKIVLTVSPVPLSGTTEHASAITADALSKSTLRLACEEAVNAHAGEGVLYWPSFEMVRWLGAHYDADHPAYGAEDGNSRHVSAWLVDLIIELFLEQHGV